MSLRDQTFVDALGLSISEIAKSVGKTDNALRRGVRLEKDYLNPRDILKVFEYLKHAEPVIARAFTAKVLQIYPEMSGFLEDVFDERGDYWVASGSFLEFLGAYSRAGSDLIERIKKSGSSLAMFVPGADTRSWDEYLKRHGVSQPQSVVYACELNQLMLARFLVIFTSESGRVHLFEAEPEGLRQVAPIEASRIKGGLTQLMNDAGGN